MLSENHGFPISNLMGVIGIIVLLLIAFLFSNNRKAIKWRIVVGGLIIDVILAWFIIRTPLGQIIFSFLGKCIDKVMSFANMGAAFVFGPLYTTSIRASAQILPPSEIATQLGMKSLSNVNFSFSFIFTALAPIIFFGSIMAVLYHYGIMQKVVKAISFFFSRLLGLSSAESIGVASNVFLGQTQAPLVIAPYLKKLSDSELFLTMVGGMATVAGSLLYAYQSMGAYLPFVLAASILAAPCAIITAKIIFPETEENTIKKIDDIPVKTKNGIEAIAVGATDGWKVALGIGIMLLSFLSVVFFVNYLVLKATGGSYSLDELVGYAFSPIAYVIGVPHGEILKFSTLIGQKTIFNEFIAYSNFSTYFPNIATKTGINFTNVPATELKTYMMACFALTGFANLSSIAIQIGGIGELVPSRKSQIAALGLKALLAAVLANLLSATVVGVFFY
jgi:concentrative nucleoside transporter, CNT family